MRGFTGPNSIVDYGFGRGFAPSLVGASAGSIQGRDALASLSPETRAQLERAIANIEPAFGIDTVQVISGARPASIGSTRTAHGQPFGAGTAYDIRTVSHQPTGYPQGTPPTSYTGYVHEEVVRPGYSIASPYERDLTPEAQREAQIAEIMSELNRAGVSELDFAPSSWKGREHIHASAVASPVTDRFNMHAVANPIADRQLAPPESPFHGRILQELEFNRVPREVPTPLPDVTFGAPIPSRPGAPRAPAPPDLGYPAPPGAPPAPLPAAPVGPVATVPLAPLPPSPLTPAPVTPVSRAPLGPIAPAPPEPPSIIGAPAPAQTIGPVTPAPLDAQPIGPVSMPGRPAAGMIEAQRVSPEIVGRQVDLPTIGQPVDIRGIGRPVGPAPTIEPISAARLGQPVDIGPVATTAPPAAPTIGPISSPTPSPTIGPIGPPAAPAPELGPIGPPTPDLGPVGPIGPSPEELADLQMATRGVQASALPPGTLDMAQMPIGPRSVTTTPVGPVTAPAPAPATVAPPAPAPEVVAPNPDVANARVNEAFEEVLNTVIQETPRGVTPQEAPPVAAPAPAAPAPATPAQRAPAPQPVAPAPVTPRTPPQAPPAVASPAFGDLPMVSGLAPGIAQSFRNAGLPSPAPGMSYGYSPMGGIATVHQSAPEHVQAAATGPGVFGAIDRDTKTDIGSKVERGLANATLGFGGRMAGGIVGGMAGSLVGGPVGGLVGAGVGSIAGSRFARGLPGMGISRSPAQEAYAAQLGTPLGPGVSYARSGFGGGFPGGLSSAGVGPVGGSSIGGAFGDMGSLDSNV